MINRAVRTRLMMLGVFITTKINGSNKDIYLSAKEQKSKRAKKLAERLRQEKAPGRERPRKKSFPAGKSSQQEKSPDRETFRQKKCRQEKSIEMEAPMKDRLVIYCAPK